MAVKLKLPKSFFTGEPLKGSDFRAMANKIITRILKRAESSRGVNAKGKLIKFPKLKKSTQENYTRKRVKGPNKGKRGVRLPDGTIIFNSEKASKLRLSDTMLQDIRIIEVQKDKFIVGFGSSKEEKKAKGHQFGLGNLPKRPFMNLSKGTQNADIGGLSDVSLIKKEILKAGRRTAKKPTR